MKVDIEKNLDYFLKNDFSYLLKYSKILKTCSHILFILFCISLMYVNENNTSKLYVIVAIFVICCPYVGAKVLAYHFHLINIIKEQDRMHKTQIKN